MQKRILSAVFAFLAGNAPAFAFDTNDIKIAVDSGVSIEKFIEEITAPINPTHGKCPFGKTACYAAVYVWCFFSSNSNCGAPGYNACDRHCKTPEIPPES